ncbi:MAG: hypothetical protein JNL82_37960 [Myxococcales bacterium]|nr:hypothetical protein [Myxococcales bacterium]
MSRRWPVLAVLPALLAADRASACTPDPCAGVLAFVGLTQVDDLEVPTDGVLLMQAAWFGELEAAALVAGLTLTVRRGDAEVAGTVEATELTGVLLWRPQQALAPGEAYAVTGRFTNPAGVPAVCAAAEVEVAFEFRAAPGPAEPLVAPELRVTDELDESPRFELDNLVCCDGAMPAEQAVCAVDHGLVWSQGQCAAATVRARVKTELAVTVRAGEATAGQWVRALYTDGQRGRATLGRRFTRYLAAPTCFVVEQRSLATGESLLSEETCVEADVPETDVAIDPYVALAERCEGPLYTCEVAGAAWDDEACAPWPEPPPERRVQVGCELGGGPAGAAGLLVLLLRRRRGRRSLE